MRKIVMLMLLLLVSSCSGVYVTGYSGTYYRPVRVYTPTYYYPIRPVYHYQEYRPVYHQEYRSNYSPRRR